MTDLINKSLEQFKETDLVKEISNNNGYGKIELIIAGGELTEIDYTHKVRTKQPVTYKAENTSVTG